MSPVRAAAHCEHPPVVAISTLCSRFEPFTRLIRSPLAYSRPSGPLPLLLCHNLPNYPHPPLRRTAYEPLPIKPPAAHCLHHFMMGHKYPRRKTMLKSLFLNKTAIRRMVVAVVFAATTLPVAAFAASTHSADGAAMAAMGMPPNKKPQTHPTPSTPNSHKADGAAKARHCGIAAGNSDKDGNGLAPHTRASTPHL